IHTSFLGYNSMHGPMARDIDTSQLNEIYLRISIQTDDKKEAAKLGRLLPPLSLNGPPFGGGGLGGMQRPRQLLGLFSCLIDRELIEESIQVKIYQENDNRKKQMI